MAGEASLSVTGAVSRCIEKRAFVVQGNKTPFANESILGDTERWNQRKKRNNPTFSPST